MSGAWMQQNLNHMPEGDFLNLKFHHCGGYVWHLTVSVRADSFTRTMRGHILHVQGARR